MVKFHFRILNTKLDYDDNFAKALYETKIAAQLFAIKKNCKNPNFRYQTKTL